jgi:hypothetical protein
MGVSGKFGAEVDGRSAALTVETTHREIERTGEDIRSDLKGRTLAGVGYFDEVFASLLEAGEVGGVNSVTGVGVKCGGGEFPLEDYGAVGDTFEFEGLRICGDKGDFGGSRLVAYLIDLDPGRRILGGTGDY